VTPRTSSEPACRWTAAWLLLAALSALLLSAVVGAADGTQLRGGAPGCSISVQDVLFGSYDPSSLLPSNTIAQFSVMCTGAATLTIAIGPSRTSGNSGGRRMRHGFRSETLAYNLYQDSALTRIWGDGAVGTPLTVNVAGRHAGRIFGQIFPGQDAWVGAYEDSVTVTVLP